MSDLGNNSQHNPQPDVEPTSGPDHDHMGVSSERVGHTGPGQVGTHGVRDTGPVEPAGDADVPPEQRPGAVEDNPVGIEPKAARPSLDPQAQHD